MSPSDQTQRGISLIEFLVVVGVLAILAAIVLIAINPGRQFAQSRNAERFSDATSILDAITQYALDRDGIFPADLTVTPTELGTCETCLDLTADLVPTYLVAMPFEVSHGTPANTGYEASRDETDRVTISAIFTELEAIISITR